MLRGHREETWAHTSSLMAMLVNIHPFRKKGSRLASPDEFNPMMTSRKASRDDVIKGPISALKIFVGKRHDGNLENQGPVP